MGFWDSTKEVTKTIETKGSVNTNVVVGHTVDITNDYIITCLTIICVIKVVEFVYFIYRNHIKNIKKKAQIKV